MECDLKERRETAIHRLTEQLCVDADTAYSMMLMTALLMDLCPEDDEVVEMILKDCGRA